MKNREEIRLQRAVATVCATLFACFAFCFVAIYQSPLVELFYDDISTGKLEYNSYVTGGVVAVVLTLLALWLNRFAGFKREWTAMAYLPSAMLLALLTDVDESLYTKESDLYPWVVIFSLAITVYLLFAFVLKRVLFEKIKNPAFTASRIIWRNLILLVTMFCLAGTFSNGEENFKREALMASLCKKGDVDGALEVGKLSLDASPELTAYRAYLLAEKGMLGEKLFEYPQLYGSQALVPAKVQTSPLVPDSVYSRLGVEPLDGEAAFDMVKRAFEADPSNSYAREYYLSVLLLDKRLPEFVDALKVCYPNYSNLPKHYSEALLLYTHIVDDKSVKALPAGADVVERYSGLVKTESEYEDAHIRGNYVRRKFGDTYWWYYLYAY